MAKFLYILAAMSLITAIIECNTGHLNHATFSTVLAFLELYVGREISKEAK